jgi:peroxiredoxin
VAQLRHRYADFQAAGTEVVVLGMGTPAQTRDFVEAQQLPFPLLSDPRRRSHRAYGVQRGSLRQLSFDPRIWVRGVQAARSGNTQTATIGDPAQLSGTFIVDRQGIIRFVERADLSSDFTSPDTLLAALASLPREDVPVS